VLARDGRPEAAAVYAQPHRIARLDVGRIAHEASAVLEHERVAAREHGERGKALQLAREAEEGAAPGLEAAPRGRGQPVAVAPDALAVRRHRAVPAEGGEPLAGPDEAGARALAAPFERRPRTADQVVDALRVVQDPSVLGREHAVRGERGHAPPDARE